MRYCTIILAFIFLTACNNNEPAGKKETVLTSADSTVPAAPDMHDARTALDWAGTYSGVVPCAGCEGITTTVVLHTDSTYRYTTSYLGKSPAAGVNTEGRWHWLDGNTVELEGITNAPARYHVGENKLFQLDMEGNRITGELADKYILNKQP
ncbi:MAG TPA: copper resistance protein NlpE [Lacibacter sp.]|nr:copper resistance protein NlpE [Lacibacter sp.]HMO88894.1 copper resistance protein NlpE [Lacibacter sp.]HMP86567.1 copper resistance protein NlpE [Lacibacter sp.]